MAGTHRAARAGTSRPSRDQSLNQQLLSTTGRSFDDWFDALDEAGASTWPEWKVKRYLGGKRKNDEWWASAVAEAYTRTRRDSGRDGATYSARVTKTMDATMKTLWPLLDDEEERRSWLDVEVEERSRTRGKALYASLADGSRVAISLRVAPTGRGRCVVTITHSGLGEESALEETKAFWRSALAQLAEVAAESEGAQ